MDIGMSELIAFVYTLGVLVTGVWALDPTWQSFTPVHLVLLGLLSLAWTAYFSWTVKGRIVDMETEDEDGDEDEPGPDETAEMGL